MSIWLQKSASIQPRTSLPKFQGGGEFHLEFHIRIPPEMRTPKPLCALRNPCKEPAWDLSIFTGTSVTTKRYFIANNGPRYSRAQTLTFDQDFSDSIRSKQSSNSYIISYFRILCFLGPICRSRYDQISHGHIPSGSS